MSELKQQYENLMRDIEEARIERAISGDAKQAAINRHDKAILACNALHEKLRDFGGAFNE